MASGEPKSPHYLCHTDRPTTLDVMTSGSAYCMIRPWGSLPHGGPSRCLAHRHTRPHGSCLVVSPRSGGSGGWGGGACEGGEGDAPEAEPSARAGLWKWGSSPRGADDQPRFTGGLIGRISLICQRTRASDRLSARLLCGTGGGRQATHRIVLDGATSSSD